MPKANSVGKNHDGDKSLLTVTVSNAEPVSSPAATKTKKESFIMHKLYCTRANSGRSAVKEVINAKLIALGKMISSKRDEACKKLTIQLGLTNLYMQVAKLEKKRSLMVDKEVKKITADLKKENERLCKLRSDVLFANTEELKKMYKELSK